ncbi:MULTISPECIES: YfcC family protein [Fusobacterium]|uniref:Transporter n=1 Tax=Fusobacterium hwasookii ChDC F128 TaxID=1216362 RepID=A0ABP2R3T6_9FUSO|nr:YfcC family protein [Fusobacterium hwasookii]EJU07340.1 transporter [Fusobacterium hwasookii ChDC F128]
MKRKNFEFPTAYTVLFLILILVTVLTHVIPAGKYNRLSYEESTNEFVVETYGNGNINLEATQKNLDKLEIKIDVNKFIDGTIKKPMAIPNTYVKLDGKAQGFKELIIAPISGIAESIDIIIFVLILGGIVGIVNKTGTFNIAMKAISQKTKGKEFSLVIISFIFFAAGGTIFGFWEETIPFYSILMPLFLINNFDPLVPMATIFLGSAVGCMFSTVNPFSTIIASNAAGISFNEGLKFRFVALIVFSIISLLYINRYIKKVKKDSDNSLVIEEQEEIREKFLKDYSQETNIKFDWRKKIILFLFIFQFIIMIWGVSSLGWWFQEAAAMFFGIAIIIMLLSGLSEKEAVNGFISGASEVVGVTLIIGLARAINIIMENGMISDTLLFYSSNVVAEMGKGLFSIAMLLIFAFLGIFIPSTSGLAVLSMPILAPLADTVGLSRAVVVDAFSWGQGVILFITPTGLIFVVLQIVGIPYNKWLKFVMPLMVIIIILIISILYVRSVFF